MKLLICPDSHGRQNWKEIAKNLDENSKFIHLGDYCDSYDIDPMEIVNNLAQIIQFKKDNMSNVILLQGNHDLVQYYYRRQTASGYNSKAAYYYEQLFSENEKLFKVVHQEGNYLFSHAGVTNTWLKQCDIDYKNLSIPEIVDEINNLVNSTDGISKLLHVSKRRGGWGGAGSCLWGDETEFYKHGPLEGVTHVFGHTPQDEIKKVMDGDKVLYYAIDCHQTTNDFLTLEINE